MRQCLRCDAVVDKWRRVCYPCSRRQALVSRYLSGATVAQNAVASARRRGELAHPSEFPCADCGGVAGEYDHRDYNKPLAVDPVCRGCNARRGRAIPKRWTKPEWRAYVARCIEGAQSNFYVNPALLRSIRFDEPVSLSVRHGKDSPFFARSSSPLTAPKD